MKKSLLALAALTAFAGVASAQSSVTLFGIVDLAARNVKNHSGSIKSLSTNGQVSSPPAVFSRSFTSGAASALATGRGGLRGPSPGGRQRHRRRDTRKSGTGSALLTGSTCCASAGSSADMTERP